MILICGRLFARRRARSKNFFRVIFLNDLIMKWYYAQNEKKFGPISWSELQNLVSSGSLTKSDLAWTDGMLDWKPLEEIYRERGEEQPEPAAEQREQAEPSTMWNHAVEPPVASSKLATLCLWMVLISLLCLPLIYLSVLLCITGIVLGHLALFRIARRPLEFRGKKRAIVGLIMGYGCVILMSLSMWFLFTNFGPEMRAMAEAKTPEEQSAAVMNFSRKFVDRLTQSMPEKERAMVKKQFEEQIQIQLREQQINSEPTPPPRLEDRESENRQ